MNTSPYYTTWYEGLVFNLFKQKKNNNNNKDPKKTLHYKFFSSLKSIKVFLRFSEWGHVHKMHQSRRRKGTTSHQDR